MRNKLRTQATPNYSVSRYGESLINALQLILLIVQSLNTDYYRMEWPPKGGTYHSASPTTRMISCITAGMVLICVSDCWNDEKTPVPSYMTYPQTPVSHVKGVDNDRATSPGSGKPGISLVLSDELFHVWTRAPACEIVCDSVERTNNISPCGHESHAEECRTCRGSLFASQRCEIRLIRWGGLVLGGSLGKQ